MLSVEEEIAALVSAGLLTEQQAKAFVYREVEAVPRAEAATEMGVSKSRLDNIRTRANELVGQARATTEAVESIRHQLPDDEQ